MSNIFSEIGDLFKALIVMLLNALPSSPFVWAERSPAVMNVLGYVNFFVPVNAILMTLSGWCGAIAIYYVYQAILRWTKVVGD